jgi:cell division protein FtsW (lipid II flippase)
MSLLAAVVVLVVGFVSGVVVRWIAGLAAIAALVLVVLGWAAPEIGLANYVLAQYYHGNELLFLAGLLFGLDARKTKEVVAERRESGT